MNENPSTDAAADQNRACNKRSLAPPTEGPLHRCRGSETATAPCCRGSESDADSIPIPPRYWWLKRISIGVAALFVFLIALRLGWGWEANRRLQAEINRIVAAGEPIFPDDFNSKVLIPDEENAAIVWMAAAAALVLSPDDEKLLERIYKRPEESLRLKDELGKVFEPNKPVLVLVHRAATMRKCDWGTRYRTPVVANVFPIYVPQRQVGRLICGMASYRHGTGDDHGSLELLLDGFSQARAMATEPSALGHFVASAINIQLAGALERILPTLQVAPFGLVDYAAPGPAAPQQIRQLREELSEHSFQWESFHRAVMAERMALLDSALFCAKDPSKLAGLTGGAPPSLVGLGKLLSPLYVSDACFALRALSPWVDAARTQTYPRTIPGTLNLFEFATPGEQSRHPVSSQLFSSFHRDCGRNYRAWASRQMAGAALAIRLFEIEHGHRPTGLDELIPRYFSQIPVDPFSPDGQPVRYLPNAPKPILYSVGPNGTDDNGQFQLRKHGGINWDELDMPFFLNGDRYDAEHAGDRSP